MPRRKSVSWLLAFTIRLLPENFFASGPEVLQSYTISRKSIVHDVHHDIDVIKTHPARIRIALRIDAVNLYLLNDLFSHSRITAFR